MIIFLFILYAINNILKRVKRNKKIRLLNKYKFATNAMANSKDDLYLAHNRRMESDLSEKVDTLLLQQLYN